MGTKAEVVRTTSSECSSGEEEVWFSPLSSLLLAGMWTSWMALGCPLGLEGRTECWQVEQQAGRIRFWWGGVTCQAWTVCFHVKDKNTNPYKPFQSYFSVTCSIYTATIIANGENSAWHTVRLLQSLYIDLASPYNNLRRWMVDPFYRQGKSTRSQTHLDWWDRDVTLGGRASGSQLPIFMLPLIPVPSSTVRWRNPGRSSSLARHTKDVIKL